MKKILFKLFVCITGMQIIFSMQSSCKSNGQSSSVNSKRDMVLWYKQPGVKWLEGLPLGNGLIGAMVFGGVPQERIALNESSFWSGRPHNYDDPQAFQYFSQIRDLVFAEKYKEAEKMTDEHFYGIPKSQEAYQPIGDLVLSFPDSNFNDYRRELDMETGVATVSYRQRDAVITRQVFVSWPDRVLVVHISSDKPGRVSVAVKLQSPYKETIVSSSRSLVMDGAWKGPFSAPPTGMNGLIARTEGVGLHYEAAMAARLEGGRCEAADSTLTIHDANAVTLVLNVATSFINYNDMSADPAVRCKKVLDGAAKKDFATLYRRHTKDFRGLMGRVHLTIGDPSMNDKPMDERVKLAREGGTDIDLASKIFQFGRYILASSSRMGGQPANLQGIWNEAPLPPWGSKYTTNINLEMNYWPAEVCNLSECHLPLFDLIKDLSETGAKTAKTYYNCGGWVLHHNTDLWRGTAPVDAARYGMWPVGGAWICQHIWEHYLFTGDKKFLKKYYPILKGSAQFLMDLMVEHPKYKWLVIPFSMSPEQGYFTGPGTEECFLSSSTTMDVGIIKELFPHCIEAEKILGVDKEFGNTLAAALKKIPPYQIGKNGWLQVWLEDWERGKEGHCISANFGWYPGSSITLRGEPQLADAIRKWLEPRRGNGGWIFSWDICDWARLEDKAKTDTLIRRFLSGRLAPNLHNQGNNQSDANFGFTAAVAECLIQSHAGEISLLPALPNSWTNGSVTGLKARGGFEVSMSWENAKLTEVNIVSTVGNTCSIRYNGKVVTLNTKKGSTYKLNSALIIKNE
jgi:alpha-L-fucosidase 2